MHDWNSSCILEEKGAEGGVIYHQAAVTLLSLPNATQTIKGKTTILILLRDIILKIKWNEIKICETASLVSFPVQQIYMWEIKPLPKLVFSSSPRDQKFQKSGSNPITPYLPYK